MGLPRGGGDVVVVLRDVQRLSGHDPCSWGAEQAAKGRGYCGAAATPMQVVAQGGGHQNGVNIGQVQSSISHWRPH